MTSKLGAPRKVTDELEREIISITTANRRMGLHTISNIISENPSFPSISHQTVANVKHKYGFDFLPPKHTFYLTDQQRQDRITFANYHLNANTDWSSVLFTDESMFVLDSNRRWLWRRRGETDPDVYYATHKYNKKVMVFGGISERYKTPLISICGTINALDYIDECIDATGLIPSMNQAYGPRNWCLMQDGARIHTCMETMSYLSQYCNVLPNWPANSPDINPIENLWGILKRRVEDLMPQTLDDLILLIENTWESLSQSEIHNLISSMNTRLRKVIQNNGFSCGY